MMEMRLSLTFEEACLVWALLLAERTKRADAVKEKMKIAGRACGFVDAAAPEPRGAA